MIRGKGVDLLLHALAKMSTGSWHATLVGSGTHLNACRSLAEQLGIASRVSFSGHVQHERLEEYYARSRCVVVPSRWPEPFGMVGLEAMARARPVAAFAVGGIPDWLVHGETGLLVDEADVDGLARAMERLLDDAPAAEAMGVAGAAYVERHFRHEQCVSETMQALRAVQ